MTSAEKQAKRRAKLRKDGKQEVVLIIPKTCVQKMQLLARYLCFGTDEILCTGREMSILITPKSKES